MNDGNFSWYITKSHQKSGRIFTVDRFGIMSERIQSHDLTPNIYQLLFKYYEGDDGSVSSCVAYISEVVKKYVDKIASDKRSALEIFESCQ